MRSLFRHSCARFLEQEYRPHDKIKARQDGRDGMTVTLKLLVLVFWVVASIEVANAQTPDDETELSAFKSMIGEIEVSCDAVIVAEFEDLESLFESGIEPRRIDFDPTSCAGLLKATPLATYLQPLFNSLAKWELEQPLLEKILESETDSDRKKHRKQEDYEIGAMKDSLRKGFDPLVSVCRELGPEYNEKNARVCYFGAPKESAGLPFQTLFRSMFENTQSMDQTVCAPDPITKDQTNIPELQHFLKPQEASLSWSEIQKSLLNDGFECRGDGYLAGCTRGLIMLVIAPPLKSGDEPSAIWPRNNGATIIPRRLLVYKGDWQIVGPGYQCLVGAGGRNTDLCESPKRGSAKGICTAGEDWHVWFRVVDLFNKMDASP